MTSHSPSRGSPDAPGSPDISGLPEFKVRLAAGGRRGGLELLNERTPYRFTGVFQFSGEVLKSVELVDKWDKAVVRGQDVPIATAYCAHLQRTGQSLVVINGHRDDRVPWMKNSPIASYCGAVIESPAGDAWGAVCHYDMDPCESNRGEVALLSAAAPFLWSVLGTDADQAAAPAD
ncbi:hypothetical protein WG902_02800 [Ramlibacter sp. PS3R-8]|uniref:hypothetical protein n=1 Tax=Ramlibacter sp. PS3R-8 TaxID=3133437 RepID=UPI0030B769A7